MMQTFRQAVLLLGALDKDVLSIAALSLRVSLTAGGLACLVGLPGSLDRDRPLPGRQATITLLNAFMGLPAMVVRLVVTTCSRESGPLRRLGAVHAAPRSSRRRSS